MSTLEVETCQIDRKYESFRIRNAGREKMLLASISERGIEEPLSGIISNEVTRGESVA